MSFTFPYTFRILAALGSQEPVELHRSRKQYSYGTFRFVTRDMSPEWEVWVEARCDTRTLVGSRLIPSARPGDYYRSPKLDAAELAAVGGPELMEGRVL